MKANIDASNIGANLKGADGKNAASSDKIEENEKAWGTALGTGDINTPSGMLVTDTALHNELRPENGNYVHANSTTAQNLTALDTQVGTNTTAITKLKDLSNITDAGKTVIKNAAKGAVKVVNGKNTTVTEGTEGDAKTYAVNVDNSAIKGAVQGDLDKKANVDATNIQGENLTKWQAALGTGAVTSGNTGLMTGGAVYNEVRPMTDGKYVKSTSTTAANLTSLDTQVTTNTGDIATNKTDIANNKTDIKNLKDLSNITDAGKTVIKNAAKGAVKVINGKNTTVSEGSEGDAKTYAVNVDDSAIKGAVQGDLNKKADVDATNIQGENLTKWQATLGTGAVTSGNTGLMTGGAVYNEVRPTKDGTYVKSTNTTAANLTALDTQVTTNTGDIATNKTDIKNLKDLSNITDAGKTIIKNAAKGAVKVVQGKNTTVTEGTEGDAKTYAVNVDDSAIKGAVQGDLDKKANVDATNIQGENLTKWQATLGTGAVTSGNTGLMTGGAVYNEVRPTKDGTYVKSTNTTATNLTALDTQVTTNTGDITTNKTDIKNLKDLSNLTDAGKTVIKNAAKG
ncbi:hypothetical protein, partial [Mitsuokella multacida]|uniref:hypothetical protein n=1 Tax=Mitsuokella multacida TaxID=52226 RepID=UPI001F3D4118